MMVLQPRQKVAKGTTLYKIEESAKDYGLDLKWEPARQLSQWLDHEDWGERGLRGLALCAALFTGGEQDLVTYTVNYETSQYPPGVVLPEVIQEGVKAVCARIQILDDWLTKKTAEQKQREKEAQLRQEQEETDNLSILDMGVT